MTYTFNPQSLGFKSGEITNPALGSELWKLKNPKLKNNYFLYKKGLFWSLYKITGGRKLVFSDTCLSLEKEKKLKEYLI